MMQPATNHPNIASTFREIARTFPDKPAIVFPVGNDRDGRPVYKQKTYRELEEESDAYARGLQKIGIVKGTRTVLMVNAEPNLFALLFALLKVGAVPVFVDPGMGVRRMLHCYKTAKSEAFIGIPLGHAFRVVNRRTFAGLKSVVTVGRRWAWGGHTLDEIAEKAPESFPIAPTSADDVFIVLFTTGSTEAARAVAYTHGKLSGPLFATAREQFDLGPEDVTMSTVPVTALFDFLFGATVVIPPMNPIRIASADPERIVDAIVRFGVTKMFASPAFLQNIGQYAEKSGRNMPSIKKVVLVGAIATISILARFRRWMAPDGRIEITYGATETSSMSTIEFAELCESERLTRAGKGTCVGTPGFGCTVRIIRISDDPIPSWTPDLALPEGEVGEIVVSGPLVTTQYYDAPDVDRRTKIKDGDRFWHRTGDLGSVDDKGRIWLCGRKSERVMTRSGPIFTAQWEGIFNAHPEVYRTAVVGIGMAGDQRPVVCVEPRTWTSAEARRTVERDLRRMAQDNPLTRDADTFLFHPSFPVDPRHNTKIKRKELAAWATEVCAKELGPRRIRAQLEAVAATARRARRAGSLRER